MPEEHVQVEQHGVVGMALGQGDRQVDRQRGHARATAGRIHGGDETAQRARFVGRCFGGQAGVRLGLALGDDRGQIAQHGLVLAQQRVEVGARQTPD